MLSFEGKRIILACGITDMRKSFNGLTALVQYNYEMDPLSESVFIFCNRKHDRLKILEWDSDGFWLHLKRLDWETFSWPKEGAEKTMTLTHEQLRHLLGEPGLKQRVKRKGMSVEQKGE